MMQEINSAKLAYEHLKQHFNSKVEEVWILGLDTQLRLQFKEMLFRGTLFSCPLHARDIFRVLLNHNSYAFILAHNHPSGSVEPSRQDLVMTRRLMKLAKLMEVPMMDHIVFSNKEFYSIAENFYRSRAGSRGNGFIEITR